MTIRNRFFTQSDLVLIRKLIRDNPSWGRTKLSQRLCEEFRWLQGDSRLKERACRVALLRLESLGYVALPPRKAERGGRPPIIENAYDLGVTLPQITSMPMRIDVRLVELKKDARVWNSLIANYHYLGLATPVGRLIRYLLYGNDTLIGAISFGECAWNIQRRDTLLAAMGIPAHAVHQHVINNNRFLILPSVRVPNLASRLQVSLQRRIPPVAPPSARGR